MIKKIGFLKHTLLSIVLILFSCSDPRIELLGYGNFRIGGTISGLDGKLSIELNHDPSKIYSTDQNGNFFFDGTYPSGFKYQISIVERPTLQSCYIENASGEIKNNDITDVNINCRDRIWFFSPSIDQAVYDDSSVSDIDVASNSKGDSVIAISASDGTNVQVYISEKINGSWLPFTKISPSGTDVSSPKVAINEKGDIAVAWSQSDGSNTQVFVAYKIGGEWHLPSSITDNLSPDGQNVYSINVAINNYAHIIVVWKQYDGSEDSIYKAEYINGSWIVPSGLTDYISGGNISSSPDVAINNNDEAIIVWNEIISSISTTVKKLYSGGSWGTNEQVSDGLNSCLDPAMVSINDDGYILIVWSEYDGGNYRILKSERINGTWTSTPDSTNDGLSLSGEDAYLEDIVVNAKGDAIILWKGYDGTNYMLYKGERRNGIWNFPGASSESLSFAGYDTTIGRVDMDKYGNTVIVWIENNRVYKAEYKKGEWTFPASSSDFIDIDGYTSYRTVVTMDDYGDWYIFWLEDNDSATNWLYGGEYK